MRRHQSAMVTPGRGPAGAPASRRRRPTTTMAATSASFSFRLVYVYVLCNENPRTSPKCAEIYRVWPKFIVFDQILSCLSRTSPNFFYFQTCLGAALGANGWRCPNSAMGQNLKKLYQLVCQMTYIFFTSDFPQQIFHSCF